MNRDALTNQIQTMFSNAEIGRHFFGRQSMRLEQEYGFTPDNTRFAEGGCCDEINEPEYQFLENYWGERFKFGGLAGYCHGGKTGFAAVSHHVPEVDGKKNLLFVAGPHIGFHHGEWGKVPRPGQTEITSSCGSVAAVLKMGHEEIRQKTRDPLDLQQQHVEQLLLPYLQSNPEPDMVTAIEFLMRRIDEDLFTILNELKSSFSGLIAVITGITINTELQNYFSASKIQVL